MGIGIFLIDDRKYKCSNTCFCLEKSDEGVKR